mmetsp:Transcript_35840/g.103077  ORF Transcript_35840/g.103077 Transcript_35840/m.103077 type:complete len:260 (-) Transcript_35840:333-1112(-)
MRFPLLSEGVECLDSVVSVEHLVIRAPLDVHAGLQVRLHALIQRPLGGTDRHRTLRRYHLGEPNPRAHGGPLVGPLTLKHGVELGHRPRRPLIALTAVVWVDKPVVVLASDEVHHAPGKRVGSLEPLSRQDEELGPLQPHQPRQPLCPSCTRNDSQRGLREADNGRWAGDAEVAGQRQLEATAEGHPVDAGNGGLRQPVDGRHGRAQLRHKHTGVALTHLGALLEVGAGAKDTRHSAADDDGPRLLVVAHRLDCIAQVV